MQKYSVKAWKLIGITLLCPTGCSPLAPCVSAHNFGVDFGFAGSGLKLPINLYGCAIKLGRATAR